MAYPHTRFRYKVEIDGLDAGGFSEVTGFDASIDVVEYKFIYKENTWTENFTPEEHLERLTKSRWNNPLNSLMGDSINAKL